MFTGWGCDWLGELRFGSADVEIEALTTDTHAGFREEAVVLYVVQRERVRESEREDIEKESLG